MLTVAFVYLQDFQQCVTALHM